MPENILDCQRLACPGPVLRVKQFLAAGRPVTLSVLVDNDAARQNVTRFLNNSGYQAQSTRQDSGVWVISAARSGDAADTDSGAASPLPSTAAHESAPTEIPRRLLVLLTTPGIGTGDVDLADKLMKNFLATLPEMGPELWRIILLNGAVTLSTADSPVLEHLKTLEQSGVHIMVCGSCLDHFGLLDQKLVGETTNMLDVVTSLQLADSVIRP